MQKGKNMFAALDAIANGVEKMADLVTALTAQETDYGHSLMKTLRMVDKLDRVREKERIIRAERARLRTLISQLKKAKLVRESPAGWRVTRAGKEKIRQLTDRLMRKKSYAEEKTDALTIVMFDIPEKYKGYRDWIRHAIRGCGFDQLQKSVFAGNAQLPEEFIKDLDRLSLLHYIQIFSVNKKGTLEKIPYP